MESDFLLLMGQLRATQLWRKDGIKGLILDIIVLRCLFRHLKEKAVGWLEIWVSGVQGTLRGKDMYLEINHIWMECQVMGLEGNAQGEYREGSDEQGDWALGHPIVQSVGREIDRSANRWCPSRNGWRS